MKNMKNIIIIIFILLPIDIYATSYYISNSGGDSNKGTSENSPWKTIERINEQKLKPGDIIFFKRGDIFQGQIEINTSGIMGKPIKITAYGEGELPVLTGAISLKNWELHNENIYRTSFSKNVRNLYNGNKIQTIARYPNKGYLRFDYNSDSIHFVDKTLNQEEGYWNGANVRMRTKNWVYETRQIRDFKHSTVYFEKHPDYPIEKGFEYRHSPDGNSTIYKIQKGYGYYIDNKFELLDSVGEWFQNQEKGMIYYFSDNNPANLDIDATVYNYGVFIDNANHVEITELHFEKYARGCIYVNGSSSNLTVQNNEFYNSTRFAIDLGINSSYCQITNNDIRSITARGITACQLNNSNISNNQIRNIGLIPGYGWSGNFSPMGILIHNEETKNQNPPYAHNNTISYNRIDSCGYSGIRADGYENVIEYNILDHCMLTLNDGGALYCYARQPNVTYNSVFRNNFVMNTRGSTESTNHHHNMAIAIYMDNYSHDMLVENNTIMNNVSSGIHINDASFKNTIRGNKLYNNTKGITFAEWRNIGMNYGNKIEGNTIYCIGKEQRAIVCANSKVGSFFPGKFDNNYYCNMDEMFYFNYETYQQNYKTIKQMALEGWQLELGQDLNSVSIGVNKVDVYKEGAKIFMNPTNEPKTFNLSDGEYFDFEENKIGEKVNVEPFNSLILLQSKTN